ncbi:MAG: SDR family NAD(P)-dependent oxidoreductase, partial [Acidimicrobiales bacterium]|nr:SDR family NAD(P)-dependent oxidoreductase [Acidimicrobiales bacterium]
VLVAGATGGLGSRFVSQLVAAGAHVTAVGRDHGGLEALDLPAGHTLALDLRLPNACVAAVDAAAGRGPLDLVVNATGVVAFGTVADVTIDTMEELFLTNVFVPIMLSQSALPHMAPGSAIVNISGVIAEQNLPGMATYGASKAALRSFQEGFAREARRQKVRVLDTRPPHTETGLASRAIEGTAPNFAQGLDPDTVVSIILQAVTDGAKDLGSAAFASDR